uniref:MAM domain-containing protein n=1 Tax=Clytia hemisphaerica TaxID=252671 RepID=A0A7M5USN9_9CNID
MDLLKVIFLVFALVCFSTGKSLSKKDGILPKLVEIYKELNQLKKSVAEEISHDVKELVADEVAKKTTWSCGFESSCADTFKNSATGQIKWIKKNHDGNLPDRKHPRGVAMLVQITQQYAILEHDFEIKSQTQCGEFYYQMYNREGCDVARFLVTVQCEGNKESETILRRSSSIVRNWQRQMFSLNKAPGTKCKMVFRVSKGLYKPGGSIRIDDFTMYQRACPKEGGPHFPEHMDCSFNPWTNKCAWERSGDVTWASRDRSTPTGNTGPDRYYGISSAGGRYLYAEADNNKDKTAVLTTPTLKSSTPYCMRFFLSMNGRDMGDFDVELLQNGKAKNVFSKKGNQGNKWREGRVELPANQELKVRMKATIGNGSLSDIALDEIEFQEGSCSPDFRLCDLSDSNEGTCVYKDDKCGAQKPTLGPSFKKLAEQAAVKNTLINSVGWVNEGWKLSFDVMIKGTVRSWTNLISFNNGKSSGIGARVPSIFVRPRESRLHICTNIENSWNWCKDSATFALNKYHSVELEQKRDGGTFVYSIKIDGKQLATINNRYPQSHDNIKAYLSDQFHPASNAVVRNIIFQNTDSILRCGDKCTPIRSQENVQGEQTEVLTFDKYQCTKENEIHMELNLPKKTQLIRGSCVEITYKVGRPRNNNRNCDFIVYQRRADNNKLEYLGQKKTSFQEGWVTSKIDSSYRLADKPSVGLFLKSYFNDNCPLVSFAAFKLLDGPC